MTADAADQSTAFVLSGGGTKGAFEVGAIGYLVNELGITPDIITATSAGTILAGKLAQARTLDEFVARVAELQHDLLAMTDVSVVFAKQPWLTDFDGTPFGTMVDSFIVDRTRPPRPGEPAADAAGAAETGTAGRRRHHRLHALAEVLEALPAAGRAKKHAKGHEGSLLTLDPLEGALKGTTDSAIAAVDPALVARPGLQLRLGVTALQAGVTRYVCEDGTIVERDARTPVAGEGAGPVDVREGVLASSSVPMIFAPRPLGDDVYVDGGVLQNIPVEAAARLGAGRIIAVLAVPLEQPPDRRDFSQVNFIGIYMRALGPIHFAETQRLNLAHPLDPGQQLVVIDPTVDVVGPFEVAQGLMFIDTDYGWMRAADTFADLDAAMLDQARGTSDAITVAREQAWYLEERLWADAAAGAAPTAETTAPLRACKHTVRTALDQRGALGVATPPQADRWAQDYEIHHADRPGALPPFAALP